MTFYLAPGRLSTKSKVKKCSLKKKVKNLVEIMTMSSDKISYKLVKGLVISNLSTPLLVLGPGLSPKVSEILHQENHCDYCRLKLLELCSNCVVYYF